MNEISKTNKIVKNTIILYVRMVVNMFVALYTSRIILQALGINDYGLYNVVGGVVSLFSFLMSSMTSATQRFISFELGKEGGHELNNVFNSCFTVHCIIALIIFILCETLGLWLLNAKISIPEGKDLAANIVYQFSILALCVNMIVVPFSACVISHEKMSIYAYISIMDTFLKLLIALGLLLIHNFDRLIIYGGLISIISIINLFIYYIYCKSKFLNIRIRILFDRNMFKKIFSFSSWTLLGQMAVVGVGQGTTILTNMFHGVVANAAMGIGHQVNGATAGLVANFQTAYQPQITKSYAAKDYAYLNKLIYNSSKVSFFLMFIVSLPIIYNIDWILKIWLVEVPVYANDFCVYFMIASLINSVGGPLWMSVFATGNIRNYQIVVSMAYFFDVILVYILFCLGFSPVFAVIVKIVINMLVLFIRLFYANKMIKTFSTYDYLKKSILPIIGTVAITVFITHNLNLYSKETLMTIITTILTLLISILSVYYIGLNREERKSVVKLFKKLQK